MSSYAQSECLLSQDILRPCAKLAPGGYRATLYLANKNEFLGGRIATDANGNRFFDEVSFVSGARAYQIDVEVKSVGPTAGAAGFQGAGSRYFDQQLLFKILGLDPAVQETVIQLLSSNQGFVAFLLANETNGATAPLFNENILECWGADSGLTMSALNFAGGTADADFRGAEITLQGPAGRPLWTIIPDPTVYTSNAPIREFIDTRLLTPAP
jgi:hypothetical protein